MDVAARIRATGKYTGDTEKRKPVCKVKCQGCGEEIYSNQDLEDVEYVKTKRGSELFIHRDCVEKVWKHGIT